MALLASMPRASLLLAWVAFLGACSGPEGVEPTPNPTPTPTPTSAVLPCPAAPRPPLAAGTTIAYVADGPSLTPYVVNPATGCLAPLGSVALSAPARPPFPLKAYGVAVDRDRAFLYVGTGPEIAGYRVDLASGSLTPVGRFPSVIAGSHIAGNLIATSGVLFMHMRPTGSGFTNRVSTYQIDAQTGALTLPGELSTLVDPSWLGLDADRRLLYLEGFDQFRSNVLQTFKVKLSGDAFEAGRVFVNIPGTPSWRFTAGEIDPTGLFLWATLDSPDGIAAYRINGPEGEPAFAFLECGTGVMLAHPTGRFFYLASGTQVATRVVRRQTTGSLSPVATLDTGTPLTTLAADPGGSFVYGWDASRGLVRGFAVNAEDGSLRELGAVATGGQALALVRLP